MPNSNSANKNDPIHTTRPTCLWKSNLIPVLFLFCTVTCVLSVIISLKVFSLQMHSLEQSTQTFYDLSEEQQTEKLVELFESLSAAQIEEICQILGLENNYVVGKLKPSGDIVQHSLPPSVPSESSATEKKWITSVAVLMVLFLLIVIFDIKNKHYLSNLFFLHDCRHASKESQPQGAPASEQRKSVLENSQNPTENGNLLIDTRSDDTETPLPIMKEKTDESHKTRTLCQKIADCFRESDPLAEIEFKGITYQSVDLVRMEQAANSKKGGFYIKDGGYKNSSLLMRYNNEFYLNYGSADLVPHVDWKVLRKNWIYLAFDFYIEGKESGPIPFTNFSNTQKTYSICDIKPAIIENEVVVTKGMLMLKER